MAEASPERGFMISYSQHYTRMPSQSEVGTPGFLSLTCPLQRTFQPASESPPDHMCLKQERDDREAGVAEGCSCGAGPSSWESEATRQGGFPRRQAHGDRDTTPEQYQPEAAETTPDLCLPEPCIAGGLPSANKLFPIFRPKSQWKVDNSLCFRRAFLRPMSGGCCVDISIKSCSSLLIK